MLQLLRCSRLAKQIMKKLTQVANTADTIRIRLCHSEILAFINPNDVQMDSRGDLIDG